MTREEQIDDKALEVSYHKTMIDKACEWLYKNTYKHVDDNRVSMLFENTIDMIEDFRKTMEE